MSIYVVDVETTQKNPKGFSASPHYKDNKIVLRGTKGFANDTAWVTELPAGDLFTYADGLIGHNVGFDLAYMLYGADEDALPQTWEWLSRVSVWDTMIAEYMMNGQHMDSKMLSLEKLAYRHGIPFLKDETVAEHFAMNLGAESIEPEVLKKYLIADVEVTGKIAEKQMEAIHSEWGEHGLVYYWKIMSSRVMTTLMEMNGLRVSTQRAEEYRQDIQLRNDEAEHRLFQQVAGYLVSVGCILPDEDIKVSSNPFMSKVLFGGITQIATRDPVLGDDGACVVYKSGAKKGLVKTKAGTIDVMIPSHIPPSLVEALADNGVITKGASGRYGLDADVLKKIASSAYSPLIDAILEHRSTAKEQGMVEGLLDKHVMEGYIHTSYNHAITATTRLSSSSPNLQNISNKGSKDTDED